MSLLLRHTCTTTCKAATDCVNHYQCLNMCGRPCPKEKTQHTNPDSEITMNTVYMGSIQPQTCLKAHAAAAAAATPTYSASYVLKQSTTSTQAPPADVNTQLLSICMPLCLIVYSAQPLPKSTRLPTKGTCLPTRPPAIQLPAGTRAHRRWESSDYGRHATCC